MCESVTQMYNAATPAQLADYNSVMFTRVAAGIFSSLIATLALAQYGTAPNNYYPDNYNGSTFTGTVAETKDDQITLTYAKPDKTDTFIGRLETACSVPRADSSGRGMNASDIPRGTVMTAFFNVGNRKLNGQKIKENLILAISFITWQGQNIAEDKRTIYLCTAGKHVQFRAYH